jgi:hypothetical protein
MKSSGFPSILISEFHISSIFTVNLRAPYTLSAESLMSTSSAINSKTEVEYEANPKLRIPPDCKVIIERTCTKVTPPGSVNQRFEQQPSKQTSEHRSII